jgi:hypothetical protein
MHCEKPGTAAGEQTSLGVAHGPNAVPRHDCAAVPHAGGKSAGTSTELAPQGLSLSVNGAMVND